MKHQAHELLEVGGNTATERVVDWTIMLLIVLNVLAVVVGTVDWVYERYATLLRRFEVVSVVVFTVEYLGRVWSSTADSNYDHPLWGRLRYASRPMLVIDLLAIAPFYMGAFLLDLRFLRVLRLFRFFRLLKLARYSEAMRSFSHVLRDKREDLVITFSSTLLLLVFSSSVMYYAEHQAQPEAFSSIPAALWWGVVTLTTVGYGDVYPVTPLGKLLGAVIALLGVGLVALPASILASGFIEEASADDRECPHCGEPIPSDDGP